MQVSEVADSTGLIAGAMRKQLKACIYRLMSYD